MRTHQLNARRRRARKFQLAVRDGAHCAYCLAPFAHLKHATLDHVVPLRLLRTWSADHLVLACRSCNHAKADRFPLLIALLLVHTVDGVDVHGSTTVFTPDSWALLARLAHARQTAVRTALESGERSIVDQGVHVAHDRTHGAHEDVSGPVRHVVDRTAVKSGGLPPAHPTPCGAHGRAHNAHEGAHEPARRSSRAVREADRSTYTHLCASPHESIRTPRRESA
ncbi:HNH endonuclease [Streptomyces erythrochromogenes]|uniref:HNH endonuclease n=1 Tax=Streptomyces erythrochromogenes TaxID=285574 RepID=UPI003418507E